MKKLLIFLSLFVLTIFLSSCGKKAKEEFIILTNQEKIELLQEMQMPLKKAIAIEAQIDADYYDDILIYQIDGKLKSYFNLNSLKEFTNYTNIEFDVTAPKFTGIGISNLYVTNTDAYLDIDTTIKTGGTETTIKSKEVMNINTLIDPSLILEYYDKFNLQFFKDLDPIEIVNELNNVIEFIDVYQKGKDYRFEVVLNQSRLIAAGEYVDKVSEVIGGLSNDSILRFNVYFINNELTKMTFDGNISISLSEGFAFEADCYLGIVFNPETPILPNQTQLASYNQVEFFTILDRLKDFE